MLQFMVMNLEHKLRVLIAQIIYWIFGRTNKAIMGRTDMLKAGDDVSSLVYYLDGYCAVLCFLFSYEAAHLSIEKISYFKP